MFYAVIIALLAACSFALAADLTEVQNKIRDEANIEQLQLRQESGKVVLQGTASTLKDKYEAEKIAKKGLKTEVTNNIEVADMQRSDQEITINVIDRIRKKSAASSGVFDNLEVVTKNGEVTIRGKVRNAYLYDNAEEAAMEVAGVRQINNEIEVLAPSSADDRLRLQIYRTLRNDDRLFYYFLGARPSINIIVQSGRVTLNGYVDSEVDRVLAGSLVRQRFGVLSVDNQLKVD
jgi:osmotically-inducible protein OsmY